MGNYQQPDAKFGTYNPTPVSTKCPVCRDGLGTARLIQSGSRQWRCDRGHLLTDNSALLAFAPVYDEPSAEVRIDLTKLQELKG